MNRLVRLGAALLLTAVLTGRTSADPGLTALVNQAYGTRSEDASLHELAHQRALFQVVFSGGICADGALTHEGLVTAEVLACNYTGPESALEQWQASPAHDELLRGDFDLIGCGSAAGLDGAVFYTCTLSASPVAQPTPAPAVPVAPAEVTPSPWSEPILLPNTATPRKP